MDLVFAVLPFADIKHPSLGVSTLLAAAKRHGFSSCIEYLTLDLASWIGRELYSWIAETSDQLLLDTTTPSMSLVGEWFFSGVLFPGQLPPEQEYFANSSRPIRADGSASLNSPRCGGGTPTRSWNMRRKRS